MRRFILILGLVGFSAVSYCQSTLLWSENYSTNLSHYFKEFPTVKKEGDTIIVIGRKNTLNGQLLAVVKYDLNGDTLSTQTYGADEVMNNELIDYKFDGLNNVYLVHKEQLEFFKSKIIVQKYAVDGSLIWTDQISSIADTSYTPACIELANDTSLFLTAFKEHDYPAEGEDVIETITTDYLYAYNSSGFQLWERAFDPDSNIILSLTDLFVHNNTSYLFGSGNHLVKVDIYNNITLNTETDIQSVINEIQLTSDNNLLIFGYGKYQITKTDLDGDVLWTEYYGTNLPDNVIADEVKAAYQDAEGNIYITGRHYGDEYGTPNYSNADILTIKYDNAGNLMWENRYEFEGNNADIGNAIEVKNGNVYIGGQSQRLGISSDYDYVVLKIDATNGELMGEYRYNGIANGNDAVHSINVFENGSVALTGLSYIGSDYNWTTQLLSDVVISVSELNGLNQLQLFPNPIQSGGSLMIKGDKLSEYSIISQTGQTVMQGKLDVTVPNTITLMDFSSGIYLVRVETAYGVMTKRVVVH